MRTILSVDEDDQSMTFAGDVPAGGYVRLMKANFDRLIDGAVGARTRQRRGARQRRSTSRCSSAASAGAWCCGSASRKRSKASATSSGPHAAIAGFYSYGEISPFTPNARCELHNQTMTITTLSER